MGIIFSAEGFQIIDRKKNALLQTFVSNPHFSSPPPFYLINFHPKLGSHFQLHLDEPSTNII